LKNTVIPESLSDDFTQLARYRYADGTTEWLPAAIRFRYQIGHDDLDDNHNAHSESGGFGVSFQRYPNGNEFTHKY
jgi:hypothetical protein